MNVYIPAKHRERTPGVINEYLTRGRWDIKKSEEKRATNKRRFLVNAHLHTFVPIVSETTYAHAINFLAQRLD